MKNMHVIFGMLVVLIVLCSTVATVSAYSLLFFNPSVVESNPGEQPEIELVMEGCNSGISGFTLYLTMDNPMVASFGTITFPGWVSLNKVTPINSTTVMIQGADPSGRTEPGISVETIARISLRALNAGYATMSVEPVIIDDDKQGRYDPVSKTASIVISGAGPNPMIPASK
ncbi:MAG: hypothetical protein GXY48_12035 [Methanomicrobiales archaeon]|nr:hypothetical protein [Methanomicrobiales archaeon]